MSDALQAKTVGLLGRRRDIVGLGRGDLRGEGRSGAWRLLFPWLLGWGAFGEPLVSNRYT